MEGVAGGSSGDSGPDWAWAVSSVTTGRREGREKARSEEATWTAVFSVGCCGLELSYSSFSPAYLALSSLALELDLENNLYYSLTWSQLIFSPFSLSQRSLGVGRRGWPGHLGLILLWLLF